MPGNVWSAAQSALNLGPEFMAASAFHPSGKELEKCSSGQCVELCGAGMITNEPPLAGLSRGLGERSSVAHGLMIQEM